MYIRASNGGSAKYFGPYYMHVGCVSASVSFTNHASFTNVVNINKFVGEAITLNMYYPTSNRAYCTIERTDPVNTDNSAWSQSKVVGTTST
jgi:hypothetical protein